MDLGTIFWLRMVLVPVVLAVLAAVLAKVFAGGLSAVEVLIVYGMLLLHGFWHYWDDIRTYRRYGD